MSGSGGGLGGSTAVRDEASFGGPAPPFGYTIRPTCSRDPSGSDPSTMGTAISSAALPACSCLRFAGRSPAIVLCARRACVGA